MTKVNLPIYTIEKFRNPDTEKDFYASDFVTHYKQHGFTKEAHKHDFYLTVLFTKGSGKHDIDFETYDIRPGSIFVMSPGQMHHWQVSKDIEGYVFFHTRAFYDLYFTNRKIQDYSFFHTLHNTPLIQLKGKAQEKIKTIFLEIIEEYEQQLLMRSHKLCGLVDLLYIELSRVYLPMKLMPDISQAYLMKIRQLEEQVNTNFKSMKSPGDYARLMNMSEKHLNRICKQCLNKTSSDVITDRIVLEAKRLLITGKQSVSEIAVELGFFDNSYFARVFKKQCGETPVEFVKKYQQSLVAGWVNKIK